MTQKTRFTGYVGMLLALHIVSTSCLAAPVITVGKGAGILWEGMPFHAEFNGTENDELRMSSGIIAVTDDVNGCMYPSSLMGWVGGYYVYKLGEGQNIGFVPRSTVFANYTIHDGTAETLTGTVGIPETKAHTSNGKVVSNSGFGWCLAPNNSDAINFFKDRSPYKAVIDGDFVIVADGTQTSAEYSLPVSLYAATFTAPNGKQTREILPYGTVVRISTMECNIEIPTEVNFGEVKYSGRAGTELASRSDTMAVNCTQTSNLINTNINVQWRAISGTYGATGRLALRQGGGYITGQLNGGGSCGAPTYGSIPFDNSPMRIGGITNKQKTMNIYNLLTWRLCSGGANLPDGPVDAAAEVLVTFN